MPLSPLDKAASSSDRAAEALRREILTGRLAPGEKLPPERELAADLGVSRLTLRAGLATLARDGLIVVRHGSGTWVRDFHDRGGPALLGDLAELAREAGTLSQIAPDLLRVRRHLAAAALEAIVERPPPQRARRALTIAVQAIHKAAHGDVTADDFAPLDLAAVAALVSATGSLALRLCLNPVMDVVAGSAPLRAAMYADPAANAAGWMVLLAWVESPQSAKVSDVVALLAERDRGTLRRLRAAR
jgi:DNA-binding FadR family transcriptional regulator